MTSYFESGKLLNGGPLFTHRVYAEDAKTGSVISKDKSVFSSFKQEIEYYCPSNPSKILLVTGLLIHTRNFPILSHITQKSIDYSLDGNIIDAVAYGTASAIYLGLIGLNFVAVSYGNRNRITFRDLVEPLIKN